MSRNHARYTAAFIDLTLDTRIGRRTWVYHIFAMTTVQSINIQSSWRQAELDQALVSSNRTLHACEAVPEVTTSILAVPEDHTLW